MQGWKCPNCGKAHAPHVETCPEPNTDCIGKPLPRPVVRPGTWTGMPAPNPVDPFRFGHNAMITGRSPTDMIWN